jgi:hypothetical protein
MALDAKQRRAIELIATGATQTETAKEIGASREAVNKWVNHDPEFAAELEAATEAVSRETLRLMKGRVAKVVSRLDMLVNSDDESVALRAIGMWLEKLKFGEKAAAEAAPAASGDVAEAVEFLKWRAKQTAPESAQSGDDDASQGNGPTRTVG